jgi:ribosome-binding protein aMBF1 (putative translation factor)
MKTRRIKRDIAIQIGGRSPRLFLVPKVQADTVVRLLSDFEVDEKDAISWREPIQDLINLHSEPGVMIRGARVKEGLSQIELAQKLGIPQSNVSEMENGKRPIGKNMARRLSRILKINYRVFL